MDPLHYVSLGVCLLIAAGLYTRSHRHTHIPFMLSAFTIDMLMLVGIEVNRHAIEQATHTISPLLRFHIALSCVLVVLYVWQITTGWRKLKGHPSRLHGKTGWLLLAVRLGNFVTSIMIMHEKAAG